ncbi:MAG: DNA repair protein RadC [Candidatus Eisenbacteria bacterium]|nr:DNA repair protein RadC [Candidatus Eisenbacteria bacterium]
MTQESRFEGGTYRGYRVYIRLVRNSRRYRPRQLCGPHEVYHFMRDLQSLDREVFYCLHLDARNQLVSCEEVSKGTANASLVAPREVYKAAILSSANSIIVAHNHPSGDPTPSSDDREIIDRLYQAGDLLGISLVDSVIIGHDRYHSMREGGEL